MVEIMVIIPAFNEGISVGSMVLKTKKYTDHVIVIDDGSQDDTADIAKRAGAEVITHKKNMGKGFALKSGFGMANQNGTKVIVTIDADGQHDPDEIPKMVAPILAKEADLVIGSRYLNGNQIPYYRRVGQRFLDKITNINNGLNVSDTQSGFRAFSINSLPAFKFRQTGFSIESEMLSDAVESGLKIKEVDIGVRYDVDCSTENPIKHGLKVLVNIVHDMEFRKPLYYFTFPGIIIGIIGIGMGLTFLENFFNGGRLYFGPTLLMILLTLVGTFLAFTGIILHSISRWMQRNK